MFADLNRERLRLIQQTNQIGIDFLLTDLNTGLTFLQVADVTSSPESRTRNLNNAYEVYRTVTRLLPRVVVSPDELVQIQRKLEDLRNPLEHAGYSCTGT